MRRIIFIAIALIALTNVIESFIGSPQSEKLLGMLLNVWIYRLFWFIVLFWMLYLYIKMTRSKTKKN